MKRKEKEPMYGSEETDLVVKYYDDSFAIGDDAEIGWYLSKVKAFGGPILDLACGTGRVALLLAREGVDVTGIDQSVGMLNQFQKKVEQEAPEVRRRIQMARQRMSDFSLQSKFNTIICCDAFFHNLSAEEQMGCLRSVAQHLTPQGRFLFNLPNPTCEFILKSAAKEGKTCKTFKSQGRYPLKNGTLLVERAQDGNIFDQTITTTLRVTRYDPEGNQLERGQSTWTSRYLFRYEAIHLLYRCGFEVESLVGDYTNGPVTEKGQLIFQVKLRERRMSGTTAFGVTKRI
jgi:2-polyprenyl-3-methyl-5-hydroxy-6-metoxy-1,4-benzoquinol methylase